MLKVVLEARSQFGNEPTETGSEYEDTSAWLRETSGKLYQAFIRTPWDGLAGDAFAIEGMSLATAVEELADLDQRAAYTIGRQADGVIQACTGLEGIATELRLQKVLVDALVASAEFPEAYARGCEFTSKALENYGTVLGNLKAVTSNHALEMNQLSDSLLIIPEGMLGGGFLPIGPGYDGSVSVAPEELVDMASVVCAGHKELEAIKYSGPWLLINVTRTHGRHFTETFRTALATFEAQRDELLSAILGAVQLRATSLTHVAFMYEQTDAAAAGILDAAAVSGE